MAETIDCGTYTVREAAKRLGVGKDVAYRAIRETGKLAGVSAVHVSGRVVIPRARLDAVLNVEVE